MNCQEAIELLPWWLNGSLEPEERREIDDHLEGCASCRKALVETRLASEVFAQHIPTVALVAYAADEAPEGIDRIDPGLLERHLEDCPQCAAELEMARASRLFSEHEEVPLLVPRQTAPSRQPRRERGWQAAALAAGLTGVIALSGLWTSVQKVHRLEDQIGSTKTLRGGSQRAGAGERPSAGGPPIAAGTDLADLYPAGGPVARGGAEATAPIQKGAGHATLILHPGSADVYKQHSFEIRDASDRVLASGTRLLDKDRSYAVTVDLTSLSPGPYVIQVFGTDGGAHKPLDRFPFTVTAQ
jgi:anti-sigma factor RsiW